MADQTRYRQLEIVLLQAYNRARTRYASAEAAVQEAEAIVIGALESPAVDLEEIRRLQEELSGLEQELERKSAELKAARQRLNQHRASLISNAIAPDPEQAEPQNPLTAGAAGPENSAVNRVPAKDGANLAVPEPAGRPAAGTETDGPFGGLSPVQDLNWTNGVTRSAR